ncbi:MULTISPECIES: hypothetical protein [unclassified Ensifer]|uniref:hypothetical protein n=1 Tax=unclassified Ensifer TaxID=2633371 RepID=UPI00081325FC|nr:MULTISPECIES: hypothetical protein [unclassified Ensifer]OCP01731.1 hypothetical protein BC362_21140 [Ensifer sp. LC14]OCP09519.1 hypothetical protein BC374_02880 [Ensifer sp. LC13]OCP10691.1 hypothetical protein BBX50_03220 [Ensifer sp. LC11]OCP32768.1 hypothetical protein BC364_02880 [Ensifer sp. LC499]
MKTLRVYGSLETVLPFDLRDFLQLLAPLSLTASWRVSAVDAGYSWFDATGPGGDVLEKMARSGEAVSGRELAAVAQDTLQVIWGEFSGSLPAISDELWVRIRAIDSTFYEVTTADETVVEKIEATFDGVRRFDEVWKPFLGDGDTAVP